MSKPNMKTRFLGFCAICEGTYKIHKGNLVHHGYKRPGDGYIHGDCFAVGKEPHETSPKVATEYRALLQDEETSMAASLEKLPGTEILHIYSKTEFHVLPMGGRIPKMIPITKAETPAREWARELEKAIHRLEEKLGCVRMEIARMTRHIDTWVEKPLKTFEEDAAEQAAHREARAKEVAEERRVKRDARIAGIQKRIDSAFRRKNASALSWIWDTLDGNLASGMKLTKVELLKLVDRDAVWALFGLAPTGSWRDRDTDPAAKKNSEMLSKMRNYGGEKTKFWPAA